MVASAVLKRLVVGENNAILLLGNILNLPKYLESNNCKAAPMKMVCPIVAEFFNLKQLKGDVLRVYNLLTSVCILKATQRY